MNRETNEVPDVAGRIKLALAAVAAILLVAALETPIDWMPTTPHEAPSIGGPITVPASAYKSAAPVDAVAEPHVEAF